MNMVRLKNEADMPGVQGDPERGGAARRGRWAQGRAMLDAIPAAVYDRRR